MFSAGMPSSLARIWANVVACPWPWLIVPSRVDHAARRVHPNFTGIEHAKTEDVAILDRAGPHDLGKKADPDAHQFAGLAAGEGFAIAALLVAQCRVIDGGQGLVERGQVVTTVVFPA